jgi:hypothetical protein
MEDTTEAKEQSNVVIQEQESRIPELRINEMILYHGSGTPGIKEFRKAIDLTLAHGIYLTSDEKVAVGYARIRGKNLPPEKQASILYKVKINNLRIADLRTRGAEEELIKILQQKIREIIKNSEEWNRLSWVIQNKYLNVLTFGTARDKYNGHPQLVLREIPALVTDVLREQGFDGMVDLEGGEPPVVGEHDSWIIFDPSKVRVLEEVEVNQGNDQ